MALATESLAQTASTKDPFIVDAGKSRFGETVKFLGVHPNDLKISGKDTDGQLSVFEYTGLGKVGPILHVHFKQNEIFTVVQGEYRFVVGKETHILKKGANYFSSPWHTAHLDTTNGYRTNGLLSATGRQHGSLLYPDEQFERTSVEQRNGTCTCSP